MTRHSGHPLTLRLYVAGQTASARRALESRQKLLAATADPLTIEIVDILAKPGEAEAAGILATPTLSDETRNPARRLVGDLGDTMQVLDFFGYRKKEEPHP
jgi:circadian clock protein KaiB